MQDCAFSSLTLVAAAVTVHKAQTFVLAALLAAYDPTIRSTIFVQSVCPEAQELRRAERQELQARGVLRLPEQLGRKELRD